MSLNAQDTVTLQPDAALALGQQLASQRKARGLSVDDVAIQLKIAPLVVQAIELEDWSCCSTISEQFMRGYARNYAQLMGVDMTLWQGNSGAKVSACLTSVNQLEGLVRYVPVSKVNPRWRWLWFSVVVAIVLVALWSQVTLLSELSLNSWLNHEEK